MELVSGYALLGRGQQVSGQQPFMQADLGPLEYCPDGDAELPPAIAALEQSGPVSLAFHGLNPLIPATVGADRTVGPTLGLQIVTGYFFGGEDGVCEVAHWLSPL